LDGRRRPFWSAAGSLDSRCRSLYGMAAIEPAMKRFDVRVVDPLCADALELLHAAALEARALYPDLIGAATPLPTNAPHAPGCVYLVAHDGDRPAGMGALRPLPATSGGATEPDTAEVRRMFVAADVRRRGGADAARKPCVLDRLSTTRAGDRQPPRRGSRAV